MFLQRIIEAKESAAEEGLRYVDIFAPGYSRKRHGTHFRYFDEKGRAIVDEMVVARIKAIGIPPAYENVWICRWANGHIQAVGQDAKGRRQYRYHRRWRETRDRDKFEHVVHFGEVLPLIRRTVAANLKKEGICREKVLAAVVSLLEKTLIRVGNNEYARDNDSYGLTTLRRKHVDIGDDTIHFHFTGKSGKKWDLSLHERRLAQLVKRCSELPGHDLFKYEDENGAVHTVNSSDVNAYLKDITQQDFTAKDFRTWAGTVLAALALQEFRKYESLAEAKSNIVSAIEKVAKQLGNTPSICRKCYVHPEIMNADLAEGTLKLIRGKIAKKFHQDYGRLSPDEVMVLAFLNRCLANETKSAEK